MRWLKGLVIGMGALIVVGLAVVIVELARRAAAVPETPVAGPDVPSPPIAGTPPVSRQTGALRAFGDARIALPAGAVVEETAAHGDRLIVRLGLPDGHVGLLLIDAHTGRRLGLVRLEGQPRP